MKYIAAIGILLFCSFTNAGTASGKIKNLLVHTDAGNGQGMFMFTIIGQRDGVPACSTVNNGKDWALSLEKESGRAIYSLLLTAQSQGKEVFVLGRGNCNSWGDREEPHYINMID